MINPSSQPTTKQLYAELRLVGGRVRWLKRACFAMTLLLVASAIVLWVLPNGGSWGL
jgi:hypothetical protein